MKLDMIEKKDNTFFELLYEDSSIFELGKIFWNDNSLYFLIKPEYKKLYENYIYQVNHLTFSYDCMKKEFMRYFPHILNYFITLENHCLIEIEKSKNLIEMKNIMLYNQYIDKIPEQTRIWMINRLYNLIYYFLSQDLIFNGFIFSNIFVDLKMHTLHLYNGWFYTRKQGEKMIGLPISIYNKLSYESKLSKISQYQTDITCFYSLANSILKNIETTELLNFFQNKKGIPTKDIFFEEFKEWMDLVSIYYKERKFFKWEPNEEYFK